jgi:hypothetical protein
VSPFGPQSSLEKLLVLCTKVYIRKDDRCHTLCPLTRDSPSPRTQEGEHGSGSRAKWGSGR